MQFYPLQDKQIDSVYQQEKENILLGVEEFRFL